AKDTELHEFLAQQLEIESTPRDSWLVGKLWYLKGIDAVDNHNSQIHGVSTVIYFSAPPMAQINYANALEEEGHFDETTRRAWEEAAVEWTAFGNRVFPDYKGGHFRLNDQEEFEARAKAKDAELDKLLPAGTRDRLTAAKREKLSPDERRVLSIPPAKRTPEEGMAADSATERLVIARPELVREAPAEKRDAARRIAQEAQADADQAQSISIFRTHVNFDYWQSRVLSEPTADAIDAHRLIYLAIEEQRKSSLADSTKKLFEDGFAKWRIIIDKYPKLFEDSSDDLYDSIRHYKKFLADRGEKLPANFSLHDIVEAHAKPGE
ncbi:MAG TPA: hypothetical protein VFE24_15460, partial [Pirellulales bacterium]|nr:hypothetical protein [Pirellulales bacterium]